MFFAVLPIRDVYPRSRIRLFSIPDPGSKLSPSRILDPGSASKNLSILTLKKPKKWFLSSRKYDPGCSSRIPDPDSDFLPILDPGSRVKASKGTGSWIRIRNTGFLYCSDSLFSLLLLIDSFIHFTSKSAIAGGTAQVPAAGGSA